MLNKEVIILASGKQTRWELDNEIGTTHKQLIKLGGETLVERIVRQCRERSIESNIHITLLTHHDLVKDAVDCIWEEVEYKRWTVETVFSYMIQHLYKLLDKRFVVLLGDVLYSKHTMDRILGPQPRTDAVYGHELEIYALSFAGYPYILSDMLEALYKALEHARNGGPGKLRMFYHAFCDLEINCGEMENSVIQWVHGTADYTQDFDTPDEYKNFMKQRLNWVDDFK